jgi:hypothetical protein
MVARGFEAWKAAGIITGVCASLGPKVRER